MSCGSDWRPPSGTGGPPGARPPGCLGEVAPGAARLPDEPLPPGACGPRLEATLRRAGCRRWSELLGRRLPEVEEWVNVGPKTVAELLGMCFGRSLEGLAASRPDEELDDLGLLLDHERRRPRSPVLEALLECRTAGGPAAVAQAAERLLARAAPWALDPRPQLAALIESAGDERHREVFLGWSLRRRGRPTLGEVAAGLGVSTSRAGQVRDRAEARVRAGLAASPPPLRWVVSSVRRRLGTVTAEAVAEEALARHGAADAAPPVRDLLLWLAGPYDPVPSRPGWLATDARGALSATEACIAQDGGVRRLADVEAELAEIGMVPARVAGWLHASGAAVVDDLVVSLSGRPADVAERVLDAHGRELAVDDIVACLGRGGRHLTAASLDAAAQGRRFRRVGGRLALAAWHRPSARPGRVHGSPPARPDAPAPEPAPSLPAEPCHPSGDDGRLWLWVRVDGGVLGGGEASVPAALVEGLGLASRRRRTFSGRFGPVTLAHDGSQPTRGSVRAVALAAGADVGDTLLLGFSPTGDVAVEVRRPAEHPPATVPTDAPPPSPTLAQGAP